MEIEQYQSRDFQEQKVSQKDLQNGMQQNNDQDIAIEIQDEKSEKLSQQVIDKGPKIGKPKKKYYQKFMQHGGKQQKKDIFQQDDWDRMIYQKQQYHEVTAFIKMHKKEEDIEYESIDQDYDIDLDQQDDEEEDGEGNYDNEDTINNTQCLQNQINAKKCEQIEKLEEQQNKLNHN